MRSVSGIYFLTAVSGSFKVYYLALLPVLFGLQLISVADIGYLGTIFVLGLMSAAFLVTYRLHRITSSSLTVLSGLAAFAATALLAFADPAHMYYFYAAYATMGLATGFIVSSANAVAGLTSQRGERFMRIAGLSVSSDIVRILLPALIIILVAGQGAVYAVVMSGLLALLAIVASLVIPRTAAAEVEAVPLRSIFNRGFIKAAGIELIDSIASAPLFVFIPLIFLSRGFPLADSVIFQSAIFFGYLLGRLLVSKLAAKKSGWFAVGFAELGMFVSIALLLMLTNYWALIAVTVLAGMFIRGTSPVIKALAMDSLTNVQMKRGTPIYIIVGDIGTAVGTFAFGLLAAWVAVEAPFVISAVLALIVAFLCLRKGAGDAKMA